MRNYPVTKIRAPSASTRLNCFSRPTLENHRSLFEQSWVGAIVTSGNPDGTGSNNLLGADARFATSKFRGDKNVSLDVFAQRTDDQPGR